MIIAKVELTGIHVLISVFLVIVILLQASKGGGLSGTFGGGGGQGSSFLGARGTSTVLTKITNYLATIFLILSFTLSMMAGAGTRPVSITQQVLDATPAAFLPEIEDLTIGGSTDQTGFPTEGDSDDPDAAEEDQSSP